MLTTMSESGPRPSVTRDRILSASAAEFSERGYAGTSIGSIATALGGVSKGLVQYHFRSKVDIAVAIVNSVFDDGPFADDVLSNLPMKGLDGVVVAIRGVAQAFALDVRVRAAVRLVREYQLIDAPLPTPYLGWIDQVAELLRQAEVAGQIRAGFDHELEAWYLVALFSGVQEMSNRLSKYADFPERIEEMLVRALRILGVTETERYLS